jgi:cystathionine beta-lyase/cystathionine gamma-synthase
MDERTLPSLSQGTLAASALGAGEPTTRALTPPIRLATTYVRGEDSNYNTGFVYERSDNLFIHQIEALIGELEHTSQAIMFGSGMAAAVAKLSERVRIKRRRSDSMLPKRYSAPKHKMKALMVAKLAQIHIERSADVGSERRPSTEEAQDAFAKRNA